ncbi:hypothetical protein BHM03_00048357 [Ensete ventricosum]|nr:hypothetical protein BHM03_00048357 [Ensete ventricosum]
MVFVGRHPLVSNVSTKVSPPNKVFNLILQVMTFFHVVTVFSMEMTVSPIVMLLGPCSDWLGGPKEPHVSDLEEDLCSHRVEGNEWWSEWRWLWPIRTIVGDRSISDQKNREGRVPLGMLGSPVKGGHRAFLGSRQQSAQRIGRGFPHSLESD